MGVWGFGGNRFRVNPFRVQQRPAANDVHPAHQAETPPQRPRRPQDASSDLVATRTGISDRHRHALDRRLLEADSQASSHSPEESARQVKRAAEEVLQAADPCHGGSAVKAAAMLERQAAYLHDPQQLDALVKRVAPTLDEMASRVGRDGENGEQSRVVLGAFTRVAEKSGDEGVVLLARTVARHFPDGKLEELDNSLEDAIKDGGGVRFAAALVKELEAVCKPEAARDVAEAAATGVRHLREQFDKAADKVEDLNKELAYKIYATGELLTPEQIKKASEAFYDRHADAYAQLEKAALALSTTLDGLQDIRDDAHPAMWEGSKELRGLAKEAESVLREVPRLAETEVGRETIVRALEEQADGRLTFLDSVLELGGNSPDFVQRVAVAYMRSVGEAAVDGVRGERLDKILEGVTKNAKLFGADPEQMHDIVRDLRILSTADRSKYVKRVTRRLNDNLNEVSAFNTNTRAGQAFRGVAVVFAGLSAGNRASEWGQLSGLEQAQVVVGGLEAGSMAMELAAGTLGKTSAVRFAGRAAGVIGLVGAGFDLVIGAKSLADGKVLEGSSSLAMGAGGVLLTAGLMSNAVPVAGTIVGGVLLAAGFGLSLFAGAKERNKNEGPVEDFLRDAGLSSKLAEELSNHDGQGRPVGPVLTELAQRIGVEPRELTRYLDTLDERTIKFIVEAAHGVDPDEEGVYPQTGDDVGRIRNASSRELMFDDDARPHSIEGLALYLDRLNLVPPSP